MKNLVDGIEREDPEEQAIREEMARTKEVYK